jgi:ATP-dependent Clp protease ATP-binding subunit ClpA
MSMPITPLAYQKEALEEITSRANAYFAGQWKNLPIHPRWHTLICGPTGVGKTALAVLALERTGASLLRISAPGWMPAGAHQRGTKESIMVVAEHVANHERTMLVLDEMDKLVDGGSSAGPGGSSAAGNDAWRSYIRGEIYDLADGRWPSGMRQPDDQECNEVSLDMLTTKLRESVFILGIGTFQDWYDHSSSRRTMGFGAELDSNHTQISADVVAERIPRELANRFNSDLIKLPDLQQEDYHQIARELERRLPKALQGPFRAEVKRRIQGAIDAKKGVRFLEEVLMQVLKRMPPGPSISK